jgi:hypothetical protein
MNYKNLSDELKINIMNYLDYETNIALSETNKNNNDLYKKIKNNNYTPILIFIYFFYLFYYLFLITTIFVYHFNL